MSSTETEFFALEWMRRLMIASSTVAALSVGDAASVRIAMRVIFAGITGRELPRLPAEDLTVQQMQRLRYFVEHTAGLVSTFDELVEPRLVVDTIASVVEADDVWATVQAAVKGGG